MKIKLLNIITTAAFVCGLAFTSCDMDQFPKEKLVKEAAWKTLSDAQNFRIGIYSSFRGVCGGKYFYTSDYQSDLFNATMDFGNRGGDLHRWEFEASQYDIRDIYEYNYFLVNDCNNILENIDNIKVEEGEESEVNDIKGETYLMRAIAYHTLVLNFCKDYEPASADTDLGLPLVLKYDVMNKPARSSLKETYNLIKSDITEARKLLSVEGAPNSEYLTRDVIDLLEARVDLCMHNYSEAIGLCDKIIAKYPLVETTEDLKNMWLNDEASEIVYRVYESVDERSNALGVYLQYSTATNAFAPDFVPSKWVYDLYDDSDIRKEVFFRKDRIIFKEIVAEDVYMLNKYPGNPSLKKSEYEYYQKHKMFRAAEAYLIAAECSYMNSDEVNAAKYLNGLREKRGATPINASGDGLFKLIQDEWIREFVGEGKRMQDLKRWKKDLLRHDPQNTEILMKSPASAYLELSKPFASSKRFVWEFPNNDLNANSNLVGNW